MTTNLLAFLWQYRRELNGMVTILWIDAICIDQQDLIEKNMQLPLMQQIYKCSAETIVWLGGSADTSEKVGPLISSFLNAVPYSEDMEVDESNYRLTAWLQNEDNRLLIKVNNSLH